MAIELAYRRVVEMPLTRSPYKEDRWLPAPMTRHTSSLRSIWNEDIGEWPRLDSPENEREIGRPVLRRAILEGIIRRRSAGWSAFGRWFMLHRIG